MSLDCWSRLNDAVEGSSSDENFMKYRSVDSVKHQ